jgi:uroporphyrinogen-III synthase
MIVVTRPAGQAAVLADLLDAHGARTLVMPLIELVDVAGEESIAESLARLGPDDWVVVASAHAADRLADVLGSCRARIAAVGATTAAALTRRGREPALVAERQSADGLVEVFPAGQGRVVVAQAADGAPTLVTGLTQLGWTVTRLDTHRSRAVVPSAAQQLAVLRADAVVFTSGTQAEAWVGLFGTSTPPVVVTIGPQTTRTTEACGLKVTATATDHSLPGVVAALEQVFGAES